jgi:SAM-dependent methyltransferase
METREPRLTGYFDVVREAAGFFGRQKETSERLWSGRYEDFWWKNMRDRWLEFEAAACSELEQFHDDRATMRKAQAFTARELTEPHLLGAPMVRRSYTKPFGYPGDYGTMIHIYDDRFDGKTAYDRIIHRTIVNHPLATGVRTRKDFVVDLLTEASRTKDNLRALSVGAGPAQEVVEAVPSLACGSSTWTLVDQEPRALEHACNAVDRVTGGSTEHRAVGAKVQFRDVIDDPATLTDLGEQDVVYSTGLFDYLSHELAQELARAMYGMLAPGGTLAIANASAPNRHRWLLDCVLDWRLTYRDEADMRAIALALPGEACFTFTAEPTGAYRFMLVERP